MRGNPRGVVSFLELGGFGAQRANPLRDRSRGLEDSRRRGDDVGGEGVV